MSCFALVDFDVDGRAAGRAGGRARVGGRRAEGQAGGQTGGWGPSEAGGRTVERALLFAPFCKSLLLSRRSALRVSPMETRLTVHRRLSILHLCERF